MSDLSDYSLLDNGFVFTYDLLDNALCVMLCVYVVLKVEWAVIR